MSVQFASVVCAVLMACTMSPAVAQSFTAHLVAPAASASAVPPKAPALELHPQSVVAVFEQACLKSQGQLPAAVDWALAHDFEEMDPLRGAPETLLSGQAGAVLIAPNTEGRVILAVTATQCVVWAELVPGPPLRAAFAVWVAELKAKGGKTWPLVDRSIERSGSWRQQTQWRYRAVGGSQDWGLSSVTTIAPAPGLQVLHLAPLAREAAYAPDGVPL